MRGASVSSCVVLWLFCGALRRSLTRKVGCLPQSNYLTQWRSREDGRGGGGLEKRRPCVQPCGVTRASLVRARAARALSEAAESRRAVAHVPGVRVYCTGCDAVRGASVSSCVVLWLFCGWGAAEGLTRKVGCLPTLRCGPPAAARQPLGPTSGRPCRRSPGLFVLSPSHSVDRAAVGCRSPHARLLPYQTSALLTSCNTRRRC